MRKVTEIATGRLPEPSAPRSSLPSTAPIGSSALRRLREHLSSYLWPLLLAGYVAILGLLPHVLFWRQVGVGPYFKSAYDEDTYALWLFAGFGPTVPGRVLARVLMRGLFALCGGSWDFTYIVADVLFPILAAIGAWLLIGSFTRAPAVRMILSVPFLFAHELFSFGGSAIWSFGTWNLRLKLAAVAPWAPKLIPDVYTPYFGLFRTPEPQVSLAFFFGALALLARFVTLEPGASRRRFGIALLTANLAVGLLYLFLAASFVLIEMLCAIGSAAWRRRRDAIEILLLGAVGLTSVAWSGFAVSPGAGMQQSQSWLFASRLPILTPASIASAILLAVMLVRSHRHFAREPHLVLAFACFGTVLVLTNQQILTGRMMETREWEHYPNYPLVLLGILLWGSASRPRILRAPRFREELFAALLLLVLARALWVGQRRVFVAFQDGNKTTLAMKAALERISPSTLAGAKLVLGKPDLAPLLEFRMSRRLPCVIDFTDTRLRIRSMDAENGNWGLRSPFKENLFEQFGRTGKTAGQVSRLFSSEVDQRAGFFLSFLFSVMDHWFPATDDRQVREREIRMVLPGIVRSYQADLVSPPLSWQSPAIRLTENPTPEPKWGERLLTRASAGEGDGLLTIYAFHQSRWTGMSMPGVSDLAPANPSK